MMFNKLLITAIGCLSLSVSANPLDSVNPTSNSSSVDTVDIIDSSFSMSCFNWRISGGCVWMKVTAFPPSVQIKPSVKVSHSIPDVVISVYGEKGKNTWDFMSFTDDWADSVNGALGFAFSGGNSAKKDGGSQSQSRVAYKFGTAIGNPLASIYGQGFFDYAVCKAGTTSFMPYFNSNLDNMLWRTGGFETFTHLLNIITPGKSKIGERTQGEEYLFRSLWGNIYPRTGYVSHVDDYKVAAVVASRIASLSSAEDFNHVGISINADSELGYWPAGEVEEWDSASGKYQMLHPKQENSCHLFGHKITTAANPVSDNYEDRRDVNGNYAWNLWREYTCCRKEGQYLISHF
jgi:integrating conjugative element protein (TIGR03756 family)